MAQSTSTIPNNGDDDFATVEDIEQLCKRMSKYDPCFRVSLIQNHLKRLGISCNDERLVKLLSLSFETMIRSIVADCARVNRDNLISTKTLTSELLTQTLLDTQSSIDDEQTQATSNSQNANNTLDIDDLFG